MRTEIRILGIETSCDETAAAIVEDGSRIISDVVSSQIDIHARYGGVVPEVASRQHLLTIIPVISQENPLHLVLLPMPVLTRNPNRFA